MKESDYLKGLITERTPEVNNTKKAQLDQLFTWGNTQEGHNFWLVIALLLGQLVSNGHSYKLVTGTDYGSFDFRKGPRTWPSFSEGEAMMDTIRAALGDRDTLDREACDIIATILKINGYGI